MAAKRRRALRDERYYQAIQNGFGVPSTPNTDRLNQAAAQRQMSDTEYVHHLRRTPEHAREFAGSRDQQGRMKMSEAEFKANAEAYKNAGASAGIHVGKDKAKWLAHNNVDPTEFATRADAYKQIHTNPALFNAFRDMLGRRGEKVTRKNLFEFVMRQSPQAWYKMWNNAAAAYAAGEAGLRINKNQGLLSVRKNLIKGLAKKGYTPEQLASGFQQLAEYMINDRPMAHALHLSNGIMSDKELSQAAFGGKKSAVVLRQLELVGKTSDAFDQEQRAMAGLFEEGEGDIRAPGGTSKQQRREY